MVVALKSAWRGQKSLAPNFQPSFWWPSHVGQGGIQGNIQQRPGQYHVWVYAACKAIINPAIACPIVLENKNQKDAEPIAEHPVLDLMRQPNPFMSGTNFYECILWDLLLTTIRTPGGQAFVIGEKPTNFRKGEIPKELWVFSDELVQPTLDSNGVLAGWKVGVGTKTMDLTLDQVIRINLFNKYDWTKGLSPLAAAMIDVDQDAKAKEFNTSFLGNNAAPSGMVTLDGAPPGKEIWEDLKTRWKQEYGGTQNAGKALFMPWLLKFEEMARTHLDFAYMEQLKWNKESVLAAYGVNKWVLGDPDELNMATAKEAKKQLFENCIKPLMLTLTTELNESWIRYIDKRNLRIMVDYSNVEALKEDRSTAIKDAAVLIQDGLPPARAWKFVGLNIDTTGLAHLEEDRSAMAQFQQGMAADKERLEDEKEEEEDKPPALPKPAKALITITKDERDNLSKFYIDKVFTPGEKELLPIVTKFFTQQRNSLQDAVNDVLKTKGLKDLTAKDFLFEKKEENSRIIRAFQPAFMNQAHRSLRRLRLEISRKALDLDSTEAEIRAFLKNRLLGLSEINNTTFAGVEKRLADTLSKGVEDALTMQEMSKAISDDIFEVYQGRLKTTGTIARTETATITSGVRYEVFQTNNIEKQEWLTAKDSRVRETHVEEDGHIVPVGETFPVTHLHYPSEDGGEASEVINCRCVALPVEEE